MLRKNVTVWKIKNIVGKETSVILFATKYSGGKNHDEK